MSHESPDYGTTTPFLLKLYHRTGLLHRPDEFISPHSLPHLFVYTRPDCTLNELALELAAAQPSLLPHPAVGTRLVFQLVYPDLRNAGGSNFSSPRFAVKDLGSLVIGAGGPGAGLENEHGSNEHQASRAHGGRTLSDVRFVVGDFVSCAILPPLEDGSIASPVSAKPIPNPGVRDGRRGRSDYAGGDGGFDRFSSRGGRAAWREGGMVGSDIPAGEWRRGERLPEVPKRQPRRDR